MIMWYETHQAFDEGKGADARVDRLEAIALLEVPLSGYFCCHTSFPCIHSNVSGAISIHSVLEEEDIIGYFQHGCLGGPGKEAWEQRQKVCGFGRDVLSFYVEGGIAGAWPASTGREGRFGRGGGSEDRTL